MNAKKSLAFGAAALLLLGAVGCGKQKEDGTVTLTNVSYDPGSFMRLIMRCFKSIIKRRRGRSLRLCSLMAAPALRRVL